jgi:succinyldiaminopimelate transaminase
LIPEIAYPSYKVGALIAGAHVHEVGIDAANWPNADLTWINTPSNPTGRVHSKTELLRTIEWARVPGRVLASDECYVPFPDTESPVSILSLTNGDNTNIIAVHSLSKRSNFAGYRGAFIVGDSLLIKKLLEIRKHAGMMVPLPVQHAMTTALGDESHVLIQAERYRARRKVLKSALEKVGFTIEFSGAGLYLWCTRNESDWESVGWLADRGILATPGSFYGTAGSRYIRVALTATDIKISEAAERIIHGN